MSWLAASTIYCRRPVELASEIRRLTDSRQSSRKSADPSPCKTDLLNQVTMLPMLLYTAYDCSERDFGGRLLIAEYIERSIDFPTPGEARLSDWAKPQQRFKAIWLDEFVPFSWRVCSLKVSFGGCSI